MCRLSADVADIRLWGLLHAVAEEVVYVMRLRVPLQRHGVAIRGVAINHHQYRFSVNSREILQIT